MPRHRHDTGTHRRTTSGQPVTHRATFAAEISKAEESGGKGRVSAIVSAFDVDYRMGFRTRHRITADAFRTSLANNDAVPIFFQHNWAWSEQPPIGAGTGRIVTAPKAGLQVDAQFFLNTESGRATFEAIKAGALREWSIGYRITRFEIEEADDGFEVIIVLEADLMEASAVLRGANPETQTLQVAAASADGSTGWDEVWHRCEVMTQHRHNGDESWWRNAHPKAAAARHAAVRRHNDRQRLLSGTRETHGGLRKGHR